MSERTARQWQSGALPSTAKAPRTWRTREDPFAEVWESEVVQQLLVDTDGRLQGLALFKALCRRDPGRFRPGQRRTLQRRVREWREQASLLRGAKDFLDESAYLCFVRAVVDEEQNRPAAARLAEERAYLRPLPDDRVGSRRRWSAFSPAPVRVTGGYCHTSRPEQRPSNR